MFFIFFACLSAVCIAIMAKYKYWNKIQVFKTQCLDMFLKTKNQGVQTYYEECHKENQTENICYPKCIQTDYKGVDQYVQTLIFGFFTSDKSVDATIPAPTYFTTGTQTRALVRRKRKTTLKEVKEILKNKTIFFQVFFLENKITTTERKEVP